MTALDLLKGRKVKVMTDMKIEVELEIEKVVHDSSFVATGESTPQNDWWPDGYYNHKYIVYFTNGGRKTYSSIEEIKVI